jgi:U3 small nucleolar RNA-associated protein 18
VFRGFIATGRTEKQFEHFELSPCNRLIAFYGSSGYIVLVSRVTKLWIANLKVNDDLRSMRFSSNGNLLYAASSEFCSTACLFFFFAC